jgi:hypothetical protein
MALSLAAACVVVMLLFAAVVILTDICLDIRIFPLIEDQDQMFWIIRHRENRKRL